MSTVPKAILYIYQYSVWSAVALLAIQEKGYGIDEIDVKMVDLGKGVNFDPTFLRLNSKATVPVLVVPLEKTLSEDVDSRYKAITDVKAIVEFLDKSRSAIARTNTTSQAPAPTLTPATIAAMTTCKTIVDEILHSNEGDPDRLRTYNARDDNSLRILAKNSLPSLEGRREALEGFISDAESEKIHMSAKVIAFWQDKRETTNKLLDVLRVADKSVDELDADAQQKRQEFFTQARTAWDVDLTEVLGMLNMTLLCPFALGDQFSIADLHIMGWLATLMALVGATVTDDGDVAVGKLEEYIGGGFALTRNFKGVEAAQRNDRARSRIAVVWDTYKERKSWQEVYGKGLF